jgi:hypothetical protein
MSTNDSKVNESHPYQSQQSRLDQYSVHPILRELAREVDRYRQHNGGQVPIDQW